MMNNPDPKPSSASDGIVAVKEPEVKKWSQVIAGFGEIRGIVKQQTQELTHLSSKIKDVKTRLEAEMERRQIVAPLRRSERVAAQKCDARR
jgi:hypothetical protein